MQKCDQQDISGSLVAKYFKFYSQQQNPKIYRILPLNMIAEKGLYQNHLKFFDACALLFSMYNLDIDDYIKFFVLSGKKEKDIETHLVNQFMIKLYLENLSIKRHHKKIIQYVNKTMNNIAEDCINLGYTTVSDYLRYLISEKKLSAYFIAGQISIYYLAAIPKFKKIISKLDLISRDEFYDLYSKFEKYNSEVNEAFLNERNIVILPIKMTNELIIKMKKSI